METKIAYFSAEFGIDSSLPIYSGGLGVLAGDHVKAANDLNIPLIGVGIFYGKGYFQQKILSNGQQEAIELTLDRTEMPIKHVLNRDGQPIVISVPVADRHIFLQVWKTDVGQVPVYLLDADIDENNDADRRLTDQLYGGGQETRISQEIILGIGGVRLLEELQIQPDVWHMNEGHSAFLALERIRAFSAEGVPFEKALEAVKASTVFTTHTPVPAGHDQFSFELMDQFLGDYYWQLGTTREAILKLGEVNQVFNMTRLAASTSAQVNGVSQLHAKVTQQMIHDQWTPDIPAQHIPVQAVTNGVHLGTWLHPEMKQLFDRYLDPQWDKEIMNPNIWGAVRTIPTEALQDARRKTKRQLIDDYDLPFNEETLVIGFARRFATYKRALLLFHDIERFKRIIHQQNRPVVILFAGKAHPADQAGMELIRRIFQISQQSDYKNSVIFLEDYDMNMAKRLVSGVDVWLNTPTKPMEASGTSGMKAAMNGVLNCSILDGWWAEGYNGQNGWAIQGKESRSMKDQDRADSEALYQLLENEIIPLYFDDPKGWTEKMKSSIQSLAPNFSASRMVHDYWEKEYRPIARRGRLFMENGMEKAGRVAGYKQFIRESWHHVHIRKIELFPEDDGGTSVHCHVHLGDIWHHDVLVEAVGSLGEYGLWESELQCVDEENTGVYKYTGHYLGTIDEWYRSRTNIRVIPVSPDFTHKQELELVVWG